MNDNKTPPLFVESVRPTGNADPSSLRISNGPPELDLVTHEHRYREFYVWTEDGRKCGSWVWRDGFPPFVWDGC